MSATIRFRCPDGHHAAGYLAGDSGPGVVVIQEWWGVNDQIRGVADRLAGAGYAVLVPDLYAGRVTEDPDEADHLMTGLDWVGATEQEVRGAVRHLGSSGAPVAVLGFCLGGALTVIAAARLQEVGAAVCYYGMPPPEQADPAEIRTPFLGHFATRDRWCTPALVDGLRAGLEQASSRRQVPWELHWYEAEHAFCNESSPAAYDPAAAALSWERTLEFLARHLRPGS